MPGTTETTNDGPLYRVYFLGPDNHIQRAETVLAETDAAAMDAARLLCRDCSVEVWQQARFLGRLDPPPRDQNLPNEPYPVLNR